MIAPGSLIDRQRLVFLGAGAFGLPTLEALAARHEIALVVSQPDRPAGRGRGSTPTPVAAWALERDLPLERPEDVNEPAVVERIRATGADAFVVIAFGQKLGEPLLDGVPAFNLHGSLLPAYRGAAPIQRAVIDGCPTAGVSVISLAQRMDAGLVFATAETPIGPDETSGELHDRLAELGAEPLMRTLDALASGTLRGVEQDESRATRARKLSRADGTVTFDERADLVRARINGLTPWPGCDVRVDDERDLRLLRAVVVDRPEGTDDVEPGTLLGDGVVACREGAVRLLEVKPPGKRGMAFDAWANGARVGPGARFSARPGAS